MKNNHVMPVINIIISRSFDERIFFSAWRCGGGVGAGGSGIIVTHGLLVQVSVWHY